MSGSRVLFKPDPSIVVAEWTAVGIGGDPRAPAAVPDLLANFPTAAAMLEGIPWVRDIAGPDDFADLVQIEDDDLVEAIDRDRALRAAIERECDSIVVDVEDL